MINIKTAEQIEGIRKSCQLAAKTLDFIRPQIVEGVTTETLDNLCVEFIKDHGATSACLGYKGFPKSICTSINEVVCHGVPDNTTLKPGDIINIDITTILDGYFGDTSKMYWIDPIPKETMDLLVVTQGCLYKGINQVFPGNFIGDIGAAIMAHAGKHSMSVVQEFVGHGVGLEFHEDPLVPHIGKRKTGAKLKPGMIFTIEPMINLGRPEIFIESDNWTVKTRDKKLSAQYEHTILVTDKGHEILTKLTGESQ